MIQASHENRADRLDGMLDVTIQLMQEMHPEFDTAAIIDAWRPFLHQLDAQPIDDDDIDAKTILVMSKLISAIACTVLSVSFERRQLSVENATSVMTAASAYIGDKMMDYLRSVIEAHPRRRN